MGETKTPDGDHGCGQWTVRARDAGDCDVGSTADLADAVKVAFTEIYDMLV